MKRNFLLATLCLLTSISFGQRNADNSLLYKVTENGLTKPTYLFGTFHLLTNAFVDTIPEILNAYKSFDVIVGEMIIDSLKKASTIQRQ